MIETQESLEEAKEKYNKAAETFGLMISSVKHSVEHFLTERKYYAEEFRPKMLEIVKILSVNNIILTEEIQLITIWIHSTKTVSDNIDQYPVEYLRKYEAIRTAVRNG